MLDRRARRCRALGGAIVAPATLSIITTTFAEGAGAQPRARRLGRDRGGGGAAGVLLGGVLTERCSSWRWILFVNVPIGVVLIAARAALHRRRARRHARARAASTSPGARHGHRRPDRARLRHRAHRALRLGLGADARGRSASALALLAAVPRRSSAAARRRRSCRCDLPLAHADRRQRRGRPARHARCSRMWYFVSLYLQQVLGLHADRGGPRVPADDRRDRRHRDARAAARRADRRARRRSPSACCLIARRARCSSRRSPPHGSCVARRPPGPSVVAALGLGLSFVPVTIAAVAGVPAGGRAAHSRDRRRRLHRLEPRRRPARPRRRGRRPRRPLHRAPARTSTPRSRAARSCTRSTSATPTSCAGVFDARRPEIVFHLAAQIDVRRSVEDPALRRRASTSSARSTCSRRRAARGRAAS